MAQRVWKDPERRRQVLEVAAREFSLYGFKGASLNRILAEAGLSKGVAYYYFRDKRDLMADLVTHYWEKVLPILVFDGAQVSAEHYWQAVYTVYLAAVDLYRSDPLMRQVDRIIENLEPELKDFEPIARFFHEYSAFLAGILVRGQALGLVRQDVPLELLVKLLWKVETIAEGWLDAHRASLPEETSQKLALSVLSMVRNMLEPDPNPPLEQPSPRG